MKQLLAIMLATVLCTSMIVGDVFIKKVTTNKATEMMGKKVPETSKIEKLWMGKDKIAVVDAKYKLIMDVKNKQITVVIPKTKQYLTISLDINKAKLQELLPPKVYNIISTIKLSNVKAALNTGKKKIGGWNCTSNDIKLTIEVPGLGMFIKLNVKSWVTKDISPKLVKYQEGLSEFFKTTFLKIINMDESSGKELEKLANTGGFEVATDIVANIFGADMEIESRCLEIVERQAPKGIYSVPEGYTQIVDIKKLMSRGKNNR